MLLDVVNVFMTQRDREEAGRRLTYFAWYHLIWWTFFPRVYTYFVTFNPTTNKDTLKWRTTSFKKKIQQAACRTFDMSFVSQLLRKIDSSTLSSSKHQQKQNLSKDVYVLCKRYCAATMRSWHNDHVNLRHKRDDGVKIVWSHHLDHRWELPAWIVVMAFGKHNWKQP